MKKLPTLWTDTNYTANAGRQAGANLRIHKFTNLQIHEFTNSRLPEAGIHINTLSSLFRCGLRRFQAPAHRGRFRRGACRD